MLNSLDSVRSVCFKNMFGGKLQFFIPNPREEMKG